MFSWNRISEYLLGQSDLCVGVIMTLHQHLLTLISVSRTIFLVLFSGEVKLFPFFLANLPSGWLADVNCSINLNSPSKLFTFLIWRIMVFWYLCFSVPLPSDKILGASLIYCNLWLCSFLLMPRPYLVVKSVLLVQQYSLDAHLHMVLSNCFCTPTRDGVFLDGLLKKSVL